jgi:hypothetical protein
LNKFSEKESLTKYIKAREKAESEAKKQIEKLNQIAQKRQEKEKKLKEFFKESQLELTLRSQK